MKVTTKGKASGMKVRYRPLLPKQEKIGKNSSIGKIPVDMWLGKTVLSLLFVMNIYNGTRKQ